MRSRYYGQWHCSGSSSVGFNIILYELNSIVLENAKKYIEKKLHSLVEKGKIIEWEKIFQRIQFTNDIQKCMADVFIEAIVEKLEVKIELFNQLAEFNSTRKYFCHQHFFLSVSEIANR